MAGIKWFPDPKEKAQAVEVSVVSVASFRRRIRIAYAVFVVGIFLLIGNVYAAVGSFVNKKWMMAFVYWVISISAYYTLTAIYRELVMLKKSIEWMKRTSFDDVKWLK